MPCCFIEPGVDASCSNCHDNSLGSADLFISNIIFLSIAKAVVHSRIASDGHGNGKIDETRGFGI